MITKRVFLILTTPVVIVVAAMPFLLAGTTERKAPAGETAGERIVFAAKRGGNWDIYSTRADGTQMVRLTTLASQDRMPIWSPDARKIAFECQTSGGVDDSSKWQLWVMDANGGHLIHLTTDIVAKGSRQWSPDGTRIVFESRKPGERLKIMVG